MLQWELWRAARNNEFDKVKLLVEHGPDVNQPTTRHNRSPYQEARLAGHDQIADYLTEHGARQIELEEKERFESACNASRREQALAILQKSPRLLEELGEQRRSEIVHSAASSGRGEAVRFVAELRFDLNAKVSKRTPMHDAAWRNDVVTIKLLLEFGADPAMQDGAYGGTPLG